MLRGLLLAILILLTCNAVATVAPPERFARISESLEWMIADSEVVVIARISRDPRVAMNQVALDVDEAIKGEVGERPMLYWEQGVPDKKVLGWAANDNRLLLFLRTRDDGTLGPDMRADGTFAIPLERGSFKPVLLGDLSEAASAEQLLAHAHRLAALKHRPRVRLLALPDEPITHFDDAVILVPHEAWTGLLAPAWARSPHPAIRAAAIANLDTDPRERAEPLLRSLLDDPHFAGNSASTTYPIRHRAWQALRAHGVYDVACPVVEWPTLAARIRHSAIWVGALLAAAIITWRIWRKRPIAGWKTARRTCIAGAVLLAVAAGWCWVASLHSRTEIMVNTGEGRLWMALSHDGRLRVSVATDWPIRMSGARFADAPVVSILPTTRGTVQPDQRTWGAFEWEGGSLLPPYPGRKGAFASVPCHSLTVPWWGSCCRWP
jgi:hypothetical protein